MLGMVNFFRLPRYRKFEFKTRYYDAEKEELESRVKKAKQEAGLLPEGEYVPLMKGQIKSRYRLATATASKQSNVRLLLLIVALFGFAYYLLGYEIISLIW